MSRSILFVIAVVFLAGPRSAPGEVWARQLPREVDPMPAGHWRIEFTNGVVERCEIATDGSAKVREPLRSAAGKAELQDGAVVISFADDRVERWTAIGPRLIVEHWCPSSAYPDGKPVLGIAERTR